LSDLFAVVYEKEETASRVRDTLARLQEQGIIEVDDAVAVVKGRDGRVRLDQALSPAVGWAATGAMAGALIGTLFLAPLLGLALGATGGALGGALSDSGSGGVLDDYGAEEQIVRELGARLGPGTSALFLLVRRAEPEKVLEEVRPFGGTILRSTLTKEAEARVQQALDTPYGQAAAGPVDPDERP
jgi:uncharacterized membrane protein